MELKEPLREGGELCVLSSLGGLTGSLKEVTQKGEAARAAAGTFTTKPVALLLPPLGFLVQTRLFIWLRLKSLSLLPSFFPVCPAGVYGL